MPSTSPSRISGRRYDRGPTFLPVPRKHLRDEHQNVGGRMRNEATYLIDLAALGVGIMILALIIFIVWGDWP